MDSAFFDLINSTYPPATFISTDAAKFKHESVGAAVHILQLQRNIQFKFPRVAILEALHFLLSNICYI